MSGNVHLEKVVLPPARKFADFCRNVSPGLILITGDEEVGWSGKTPKLEFAFEIAARMVECESTNRIVVWSWQSFLSLCGVRLTGGSQFEAHHWVLQREAMGGARIEAWLEEPLKPRMEVEDPEWLQNAYRSDWISIMDSGNDVVLLDFQTQLGFADMRELNKAAKAQRKTVLACADLKDAQGKAYSTDSYAELAMRIGIEHGVDFSECAETVVLLVSAEDQLWENKFIRVGDDDRCPFEVRFKNRDPEEERFLEVSPCD